ncbi:carbohydrate ABC transporter permease [Schaalia sp. 19OD2882]|uniref:carbohydrate ABC transporter permease n=1 Tax=Schaalia sp. 19OD2882 TaxID=2794089 RepID=UPI001C1EDB25|nr:carbohydrate ABC transporter permease [Schaalia sp. 19OD2882]QWW20193.1 carbohydrate ABC transporter permease [Schaalia sp. 19OD2882]
MKKRRNAIQYLHLLAAPWSLLWVLPVLAVLSLSLMPTSDPTTTAWGLVPNSPSLSNYSLIFAQNPILRHVVNSLLITVPSVILTVLSGSMVAFALVRLRFPGKPVVFALMVLTMVLPMASIVVAVYRVLQFLGLYNSIIGLVLVYTALGTPFAVIMIRNSFAAIPDETYEAALVDGAGKWRILFRIYLPLAKASVAVVVVWQSMMTWNDFLLPLVSIADNILKPLVLVPLAYQGIYLSQPGALFAVLVLISMPMVLIFLLMQRGLVNGLAGAIK